MNTYSYLRSTTDALADRWHSALQELNNISHTESRLDHIAYMQELYDEAVETYDLYSQHLHPVVLGKLTHIIGSDFDRHIKLSTKLINSK